MAGRRTTPAGAPLRESEDKGEITRPSMYDKCLICNRPFERAAMLGDMPVGDRVAYDPARGRLWALCRGCERWSLAPVESRWEALEDLERLVRDQGRLLAKTANVGLLRAGPLEIVRVGRAGLAEEAWWRYGRRLRQRRRRHRKLAAAAALGAGVAAAGAIGTGGGSMVVAYLLWDRLCDGVLGAARRLRFGQAAWRGNGRCPRCGLPMDSLRFRDRTRLVLDAGDGALRVAIPCVVCGRQAGAGLALARREGERALGRALAYHHFSGASPRRVEEASRLVEVAGGPERTPSKVVPTARELGEVGRIGRIALEIAVHEERERRLLEMEIAELEAHWRKEEALAEIIDGELAPAPASSSIDAPAQAVARSAHAMDAAEERGR